jgi:PII-like signaling protein
VTDGYLLHFYMREDQRHHHHLLWEWLLEQANKLGIGGGSAFRAIGGFGHHHVLHDQRFFELAGTLAVKVEFIVNESESKQLLELVEREKITLFYVCLPARFGNLGTQ